jgi:hypothetical protein
MTELKNEFSWPKTKDEVFKTCLRQYWFSYYGYWNGWLENASERTRQIYILKNLKNRQIWAGEKVHECIQRSLSNIRKSIKVLPIDEIVSITLDLTRDEVEDIKGYIKGSIKDMQSILVDVGNNIPAEEDRFSKVEDDRVSLRCNFRKIWRV